MFRILLVDDEAEEREGISFLIKKYQLPLLISEAQNGQKAWEYLKEHPVDILFTDVKMPYKDGLELAKETFEQYPKIKIVIFSAYGEFEYARKAMEAHAVDYLLKPIELDAFEKIMNKVIEDLKRDQEQSQHEKEQKEASKKSLLYTVFTGGNLTGFEKGQLEEYFRKIKNGRKLIINIESGDSIFEQNENVFLKLLDTYISIDYEYVNLYPNASVILLSAATKILDEDLKKCLFKIGRDVRLLLNTGLSVVVSREFKTMEEMMRQVDEVNVIRRDFYGRGEEITYLSEIVLNSEYYEAEVERIKKLMLDAIHEKEEDLIILYGDRLVETMGQGHVVSRIYVHHIFYDILSAFYEQYRINDKTRLFETVNLLLSYKDSGQILDKFKEILNEVFEKTSDTMEDSHTIAEKIQNIIRDEYGTDISLDELAGRVNLAPAYVSYLFKKETGNTIVKYITDYRMEKARQLLDDRELKIIQVGKACGYENQPYFNRLFKNYHGVTPRQYRDKNG